MDLCQPPVLRILVVDDHELTRLSLKIALQSQLGIELVGLASNGQEAIQLAKISHPCVVILDLQMPVMDGASASKQLKRLDPRIKIIGYSSVQMPYLEGLMEQAELDAFCDKSTCTQDLVNVARQLVARA